MKLFLSSYANLCRPAIAFLSACSALTGYLLAPHHPLLKGLLITSGVFLLAAAASALNQCQERDIDSRMERTRTRPIPAGFVTARQALSLGLVLLLTGLCFLLMAGTLPAFLGACAVVWYNGLYTPLKRITAFAAVPGAVVGVIPPAMGWTAAGGTLSDSRLFPLCFLFFMWQVPHFWLQILDHGNEYEQAGLPALSAKLRKEQLGRMTFIWIFATSVSGLLLPLFGTIREPFIYFMLFAVGLGIVVKGSGLLTGPGPRVKTVFRTVNTYIVAVMTLIAVESLLRMP